MTERGFAGIWRDPILAFLEKSRKPFRIAEVYAYCEKVRGYRKESAIRTYLQRLVRTGRVRVVSRGLYEANVSVR